MTGREIARIQNELGMTPPQFAQLLGVHISTIYRWVTLGKERVRLDPLHASLLARLQVSLRERKIQKEREDWAGQILTALLIGGTLAGLAIVLKEIK